jgi:hypothetical protein
MPQWVSSERIRQRVCSWMQAASRLPAHFVDCAASQRPLGSGEGAGGPYAETAVR